MPTPPYSGCPTTPRCCRGCFRCWRRAVSTHQLLRELAAQAPWAASIGDADSVRTDLLDVGGYYDLLAPQAAQVDVWRTIYQHPMASAAAIVEWLRGTGLRPYVERLSPALQASYLAE